MEEEYKKETLEKEKSIPKIDLEKLKESMVGGLVDCGLIDENGLRISGMGILIRKMEKMLELQDKTNLKLHFIEKKLERSF